MDLRLEAIIEYYELGGHLKKHTEIDGETRPFKIARKGKGAILLRPRNGVDAVVAEFESFEAASAFKTLLNTMLPELIELAKEHSKGAE